VLRISDFRCSPHRAGHHVRWFQRDRERFERHGLFVIEEFAAEREEFGAGSGAADTVQELTSRFNAEADEIHILLHVIDLGRFPDAGGADGFVKRVDIREHVEAGRAEDGLALALLADLAEEPGIADDAASNHEPARAAKREDFAGFAGGIDVAIREHRARQRRDGARDEVVTRRAAIHLFHRPRVDGKQVERMTEEDGKEFVENSAVIEADARFHRERDRDGFAQCAQDSIDAVGVAEQTAAGAFAIHDRNGAAEVQINRRDRVLLQLARGADERRDVVADHLRDDRAARRILRDGGEDLRIESRFGQDPEVFGEIKVRVAVAADQAHEAQVRDILHRREREDGSVAAQQVLEFDWGVHDDLRMPQPDHFVISDGPKSAIAQR
jgi:hypothetical protein